MRKLAAFTVSAAVLGIDRCLKMWVASELSRGDVRPLLDGVLRITRVHNTGGAFGIFPGGSEVFVAVSLAVSAVLAIYLVTSPHGPWPHLGAGLTLGGAIANAVDRIAYGYVLDYLEIRYFSVLNLADACVTVGVIILLFYTLFGGARREATR
jgi:signal peptidase II